MQTGSKDYNSVKLVFVKKNCGSEADCLRQILIQEKTDLQNTKNTNTIFIIFKLYHNYVHFRFPDPATHLYRNLYQ